MIKIGLVGCGKIACNFHIPSIDSIPNTKIVAVCDKSEHALARASSMLRNAKKYKDFLDLVSNESLDMVDICTPGFTHYKLCLQAIERGIHVLVEKPVALSLDEVRDLKEKSKKYGVKLCVMQSLRFKDNVLKARKAWKEGKLGKIVKVHGIHHGANIYNEPSWLWDERRSGGIPYELGIHHVDLQSYFCGEHEKIVAVNTHIQKTLNYTTGVEAIIRYKSGAVGTLDLAQDTTLHSALFSRFDIYGTGSDVFLKFYPEYFRISSGNVYPLEEFTSELGRIVRLGWTILTRRSEEYRIKAHKRIIRGFVETINGRGEVPVSIDDVMNTMKLLEDLKQRISEVRSLQS